MAALAPPANNAGVTQPPVPNVPASLSDITNAKDYLDRLSASQKAAHQPTSATVDEIGEAEAYKAAVIFSHSPGGNVAPLWLANLLADIRNMGNKLDNHTTTLRRVENKLNDITITVNNHTTALRTVETKLNDITAIVKDHTAVLGDIEEQIAELDENLGLTAEDVGSIAMTVTDTANDVRFLRRHQEEAPIYRENMQAGLYGRLLNPTEMDNYWAPPLSSPNPQTRDELIHFTEAQCIASAGNLGLPALVPGASLVERRRQIAIRIGVTL